MSAKNLPKVKKKTKAQKSWTPTRSASKGAIAYHSAVVNTSWHKENVSELIRIIRRKVKSFDSVVDFGAGTGASAVYLLKDLKPGIKLLLVDNSPSWLTKAYDLLHSNKNVSFFILEKTDNGYTTLSELLGSGTVNHVVSANTVHLIPNIQETFEGIFSSLKSGGTFTFQSGNIKLSPKERGVLMIDDSIHEVHDRALGIIRKNKEYKKYAQNLEKRIKQEETQRKFVFPSPRPLKHYLEILKSVGFKNQKISRKHIKVKYKDWLEFLRVRRLQAGILPEIGGKEATPQEEHDRDLIIAKAASELFETLKEKNSLANKISFTAKWVYVYAEK